MKLTDVYNDIKTAESDIPLNVTHIDVGLRCDVKNPK